MPLLKKSFLVCAGVSLVVLTGCASKPPVAVPEQAIVGRVPADPPKNPVINADALKAESKSIAVTDIYFKKENLNYLCLLEKTRLLRLHSVQEFHKYSCLCIELQELLL